MTINEMLEKLYELQSRQSAYAHALSLLSFDGATTAPKNTAANRGHTCAILSGEAYRLATGKETVDLLEALDREKASLPAKEQRMLEVMLHSIRNMQKIPEKEYIAYHELLTQSDDVWHTAKETNDFTMFLPYLERIFETQKRFAALCGPEMDPYDYWLNEYEDGLNMQRCDAFFSALRERLVPLIKKVSEKPQVDATCLLGDFTDDAQEKLALALMEKMGLDLKHVGLGTTEHPFTTSLGSHLDERITTNYNKNDFSASLFSVIHEGGHALYDTGSSDDLAYTCLDGGLYMSIHESQSRFYENLIGRSRAFVASITPLIHEYLPQTQQYTADDFFRALNKVQPSLIRTESDEVTYCLHVMVRYDLEKALMHGELEVKDLPAAWNRLYKEYLGVDVPDDTRGVLQDCHWSGGMIGYFPSYALGSAYGAQFMKKMRESVPVDACLEKGDLATLNAWNREHIWQYGGLKKANELLRDVLHEEFDPNVYLDYLEEKCREIYGI